MKRSAYNTCTVKDALLSFGFIEVMDEKTFHLLVHKELNSKKINSEIFVDKVDSIAPEEIERQLDAVCLRSEFFDSAYDIKLDEI